MSDMPNGVQQASGLCWILAISAVLLTVVAGVLGWIEVAEDASPAPRSFVLGCAVVAWIATIGLSCSLLVVRKITKRIDQWGERIIQATCKERLEAVADLMEADIMRWINEQR